MYKKGIEILVGFVLFRLYEKKNNMDVWLKNIMFRNRLFLCNRYHRIVAALIFNSSEPPHFTKQLDEM